MSNSGKATVKMVWNKFRNKLYDFKISTFRHKSKKNRARPIKKSMTIFAWSVMSIQVVLFAIFYVYQNFSSLALAFIDTGTKAFTLNNFKYVFSEILGGGDSTLFIALRNTTIFFFVSLILMISNIFISSILYKKIWGYKTFQIIFFLPTIIGSMVWVAAYKNVLAPNGPLFSALISLNIIEEAPEIFADSRYALQGVIGMSVWLGLPSGMLLYCGSLARIPKSIIEYGRLEGITLFNEVRYLLVPLIWPLISTNLILTCIGFFNSSGNILLLTQGKYDTTTFSYWIYEQVIIGDSYNVPSALGLIMTVATLPFAIIGNKLTKMVESVEF